MTDYMLTLLTSGGSAVDVRVNAAANIGEAIRLAEAATGCRCNHGRGGVAPGFDPQLTIAAPTGDVIRHHSRTTRVEVALGPPDVMQAIAQALQPPPKAQPRRKTGKSRADG